MAKLALLAGGGALPEMVASSCRHQGRELLVIGFNGFTDPDFLARYPSQTVRLGQMGKVRALLKKNKVDQIVFAGHLKRPAWSQIRPDWQGLKMLWKLRKQRLGDDGLLRQLSAFFEKDGVRLIGADQIVPDSIMPKGVLTQSKPSAEALKDIAYGQKLLKTWGDLDQGQSIILQQGLVLGVEAIEGTDELIRRCGGYKRGGIGPILVKIKKPQQDRRLDLPTIGIETIKNAIEAGYSGIAVQAGDALFLQPHQCLEEADKHGVFIIGIDAPVEIPHQIPMTKKIYIIAGEASGDVLGASLMADLKKIITDDIQFFGIGGTEMQAQGLQSLFPMTDLSIMGLAEVLKHLPLLIKRINQTVSDILKTGPDVLITVDSPDFCLRVAKKIKRKNPNMKIVHYVAPTVWAWRPGRAKKIAQFLDGLLCLFPFEPSYFTKHGLKAQFVGHSLTRIVKLPTENEKAVFYHEHNLSPDKPILCVLPGSRHREIDSLLPVFKETIKRLQQNINGLQVIVPTLEHLKDKVAASLSGQNIRVFVPQSPAEKYTAFNLSNVALHASGTVALELALCHTPMVTAYKVSPLSAFIGRKMLTTLYVNLVNILLNRPIVPEMLQEQAVPEMLAPVVQALLTNPALRKVQQDELHIVAQSLNENAPLAAAHFVESFL